MSQSPLDNLKITLIGRLMYHLLPLRKQIVMQNIDRVYPSSVSKQQKINLAKAFYSHFLTTLKEIIAIRWCRHEKLLEKIEIRGQEHLLSAHAQQRGVILLSGHIGNWEFAPLLAFPQLPCSGDFYIIRRAIRIKWLEEILFQRFQKANLPILKSQGMLKSICKLLRMNKIIVFTFDQHANIHENHGIAVDFFGNKAGTYKTLAFLAGKTGAQVVPASYYRLDEGKHIVEFHPALPWQDNKNWEQALYVNTRIYNQTLEQFILANPAQWLWPHRRWKLQSPEREG